MISMAYVANFDVSIQGIYFGQTGNWKGSLRGFLTWIRGSRLSVQALGLGARGHRFRPDPGGRSEWSPHTGAGRPRSAPDAGAVFRSLPPPADAVRDDRGAQARCRQLTDARLESRR